VITLRMSLSSYDNICYCQCVSALNDGSSFLLFNKVVNYYEMHYAHISFEINFFFSVNFFKRTVLYLIDIFILGS
jgi:hypothetical protein